MHMKKNSHKKVTMENITTLITESHESLARMVANGFKEQEKVLSTKIESEIQGIEQRLGAQILGTNNRIDALVDQKVSWDTHTRLADRVSRLEHSARMGK